MKLEQKHQFLLMWPLDKHEELNDNSSQDDVADWKGWVEEGFNFR